MYHGGGDAFVAKVSGIDGSLAWATYLGGSGYDSGRAIAVDGAGNALVTGSTNSADFAGANNLYHGDHTAAHAGNAYAAKVTSGGALAWATYLGGSGNASGMGDYGYGIAVDGAANVLVTGRTYSSDFVGGKQFVPRHLLR